MQEPDDTPPPTAVGRASVAISEAEPSPPPPTVDAEKARKDRWELRIAIVMAVITLSSAFLTYLAAAAESTASGYDQQSVVATVQVATHRNGAQTRVAGQDGIAGQYRAMLAQADALQVTDPEQARILRIAAASVYSRVALGTGLVGSGATATFDAQAQLAVELHRSDYNSVPDDEPDRAARLADAYHRRTAIIAGAAVALLAMLVLVTIVRVTTHPRWRRPLLLVAALGYVAAGTTAVVTAV